jgi:hypothetical protein
VIEHVDNIIATMEEFHRVTRPGGKIFLATPHYTDFSSFRDPTHRWHLNTYSFLYFYPGGMHGRDMWYTKVRMREVKLNLKLLKLWKALGFEFLVNHSRMFRQFWEHLRGHQVNACRAFLTSAAAARNIRDRSAST